MSTNKTTTPSTLIQPYLSSADAAKRRSNSIDQRWAHR